jgi:uncharacterized protein YacL
MKKIKTDKITNAALEVLAKQPAGFTKALADEIVKGLTSFGRFTTQRFRPLEEKNPDLGDHPILVDTSVLIDGRILPIVNSGFLTGTLLIPQFILGEVQHIADSSDSLSVLKAGGIDGGKLKWQRVNQL